MSIYFLCGISCIIGGLITFIVLYPTLSKRIELEAYVLDRNDRLEQSNNLLSQEINAKENKITVLNDTIKILDAQQEATKKRAEEFRFIILTKTKEDVERAIEDYKQTYKDEISNITVDLNQEYSELTKQLNVLRSSVDAAVEAAKRDLKDADNENFYRLILSQADILEIQKLREVAPYLRDSEPLNKIIWKVYYEKPYTDLVGRIIGKSTKTGIYKITNLKNKMCYVGQAVDIASRWKQHIKRGVGAEAPTKNKLYPAMKEFGVENFSFEIIEECEKTMLDKREDFWQDYFKAKEFGYSIK